MAKRILYRLYCIVLSIFILGSYNGHIALWESDRSGDPIHIYPISVNLLPDADRIALDRGICASTPEALAQLLEDYLS